MSLRPVVEAVKKRFCRHEFAPDDLKLIDENGGDRRVRWDCSKCGKEFYAHCGLDISLKHGPIFRRGEGNL